MKRATTFLLFAVSVLAAFVFLGLLGSIVLLWMVSGRIPFQEGWITRWQNFLDAPGVGLTKL